MITSYYTQRQSTRLIWFVYPSKRYQLAETDEAYEAEMTDYAAELEYGFCHANQGIRPASQEEALNLLITTCYP
jgi:hypothetical protein